MPDGSSLQLGDCTFCDRDATRETLLYEGRDLYVIADFAPVAAAHLLLIPKQHYPHLASLPPEMDAEFHELKASLGDFVRDNYGRLTYWENGVFGQSVPHAHLHSISLELDTTLFDQHGVACDRLQSLRSHVDATNDHYFMIEHAGVARVMPPDPELYGRIIRHAKERNGGIWRYSPPERRMHGKPIVQALIQRWREHLHA
jgi:diadenosine tetraphosphate (Ap4A) HIT family hydrolase